jgi:hypothetical protein
MITEVHEMIADVSKSLVHEIMKERLDYEKCLKTTRKTEWVLH